MPQRIFSIALLTLSLHTFCQERLSLADAISIGLERNHDIQIENRNVIIAKNNNNWGETGFIPSLSFVATSNNNIRNQESDNLFFGGQLFPGFTLDDQRTYALTPGLQANWTIYQGGKARINKQRLELLNAETEGNASIVVENTVQSIILAYYLTVLENERLAEFQDQLDLSRDKYGMVQNKYDLGVSISTDLLLEENNYLTDSINVLNQAVIARNSLRNLNILLAEDNLNKQYMLTDSLYTDNEILDLSDLLSRLDEDNVDLRKIYLSQEILRQQTALSKADQLPVLSLVSGYNWNRNVSDLTSAEYSGPNENYQNPPEPLISKTGTYYANFTLSFNLFNGGRVKRAIRNAVVQEDIGNIQIDRLRTRVSKDLYDAYDQYLSRSQIYQINVRRRESALINMRNSEAKFQNGSINSFDYRTVQNNYLTASLNELQALYNLIDSKVTLKRLTGGLVEQNLDPGSE